MFSSEGLLSSKSATGRDQSKKPVSLCTQNAWAFDYERPESSQGMVVTLTSRRHRSIRRSVSCRPSWVVDGLVHHGSELRVHVGAGDAEDTFGVGLACAVSAGTTWLGIDCACGRALIVSFADTSRARLMGSVGHTLRWAGLSTDDLPHPIDALVVKALSVSAIMAKISGCVERSSMHYDLIVLEHLERLAPDVAARLLDELRVFSRRGGTTVVDFIHDGAATRELAESLTASESEVFLEGACVDDRSPVWLKLRAHDHHQAHFRPLYAQRWKATICAGRSRASEKYYVTYGKTLAA